MIGRRTRLLVCLLLIACAYLALWSAPAYFRVNRAPWGASEIVIPPGQSLFTIVQFADLHYGEDDTKDANSTRVMHGILRDEPGTDLAVFSGDQVSGYVRLNQRDTLRKWVETMQTVKKLRIPFASIFGNHDDQAFFVGHMIQYHLAQGLLVAGVASGVWFACRRDRARLVGASIMSICMASLVVVFAPSNVMRRSLLHYERASFPRLSVSMEGPADVYGLSNYYVRVRRANQTALVLLLDSGGGRLEETYTDQQLKWVRSVTNLVGPATAIAFAHITPVEFRDALTDPGRFSCIGCNHTEAIVPAGRERLPVMAELGKAGIKALFSGHDHRDSYCCVPGPTTDLPAMCYGRHTGYGGYGDWMRGARVIQLRFSEGEPAIWTWLRMENGLKRELVRLS